MDDQQLSRQEQLLRKVLAGVQVSAADIDALLGENVPESLHLDYKSGLIGAPAVPANEQRRRPSFEAALRRHVVGFANAEGGVLVLGVAEAPVSEPGDRVRRTVDGVPADSADALYRRIGEAFAKAVPPSLASAVRHQVVEHRTGLVALVATPRLEAAAWAVEGEKLIHYFRLADSTIRAPDYLVQDLLLGRRQRPQFDVSLSGLQLVDGQGINVALRVRNTGLTWLEATRCGVVGVANRGADWGDALTPTVLHTLQMREVAPGAEVRAFAMTSRQAPPEIVGPFESTWARCAVPLPYLPSREGGPYWCGAVYVSQLNQPVKWYQLVACVQSAAQHLCALFERNDGPIEVSILECLPAWLPEGYLQPVR